MKKFSAAEIAWKSREYGLLTDTKQVWISSVDMSVEQISDHQFQFMSCIWGYCGSLDQVNMHVAMSDYQSPVIAIIDRFHIVMIFGFSNYCLDK